MQALILAGGEGTRLRPLTSTTPKPVVPLAGRPFIAFMIEWLVRHGVDDVVLACGFMAETVREVLGDGSSLGVRLRYLEEPRPLGTGGAIKFAEDLLEDRFLVLNGDVLTDLDLTAQLRLHEERGAIGTLALIEVEDPSAYGLVRLDGAGAVTEFLEKPEPAQFDTCLVNAGAYVLEREVLGRIRGGETMVSIEREVFPKLVGDGLFGYPARGYWLDIGTPERYLQGTFDILAGIVETSVVSAGDGPAPGGGVIAGPAVLGCDVTIGERAQVGPRAVLGDGVELAPGARVQDAVILEGTRLGPGASVSGSILGRGVQVGAECQISDGVVVGDGVEIGAGNTLAAGARIFPGVTLAEGGIRR